MTVTTTTPPPMPHVDGVSHGHAVVGGVRLHYVEAGTGDPLVLLHGWPQHWFVWRALIGPLAREFRVICPDLRGFGWSEGTPDGYDLKSLGQDIVGLLDALDIPRARLVGHDVGGAAGFRACLDHPDRFERFVALATVPPWLTALAPPALFLRPWHFYALGLPGGDRLAARPGLVAGRLRAWRYHGSFTAEETDTYVRAATTPLSAHAAARFYRGAVLRELPTFLRAHGRRHLTVPTLQLNGAHDPLGRRLPDLHHGHADDMTVETVPGAGHFIPEERPDWTLDRVGAFLRP
ncbi:alpha/beta fold hydrolase [Streptomyces sp. NBC_01803]|uniref:alpha/beta fold hydrolase n=1 Tax=Streptomyces sp. NBC_01803 TaxID=2975946 RepID=UPI002DD901AC|nr:alpha/beta hydrolase [Streptomyces sp. NBC_01803]WSA43347.1 alpha/beta hydrolase [Streptomyces sp. NBC_01803]